MTEVEIAYNTGLSTGLIIGKATKGLIKMAGGGELFKSIDVTMIPRQFVLLESTNYA